MLFDDNRLLFLDDSHIEKTENVTLGMNPPQKAGACLVCEREWEQERADPVCITRWQGEWRMYLATRGDDGREALELVTSSDGVTWERPDLGAVSYKGSKHNNLVDIENEKPGEFCVFEDPSAPLDERFKLVAHEQAAGGVWVMGSPDGLRFTRIPGLVLRFIADSNPSVFYDERIGKTVLYVRGWDKHRIIPPIEGTRCVLRAEADDLHKPLSINDNATNPWPRSPKWTAIDGGLRRMNNELPKAIACDNQDPPEAGLYQAAAVQYLPDAYLAFPTLYFSYPRPPWHFINDGLLDLQFAASRDGVDWKREYRGSYVRLDLPDGPCSKTMHMVTGMVPYGHCISQYYAGSQHTHGEGRTAPGIRPEEVPAKPGEMIVSRLEQRLDGFVSADSAYGGGTLVTRAFAVESDQLRLNIDTSASGVAHAALLDEEGTEIPGFSEEECDRIQGNDTQYVVSWKGSSDLSRLKGRKVKLVLVSRSSKLFAVYP